MHFVFLVVGVPGLMARKTTTLKRIFRQLVDGRRQQKYDPFVVPLGFDEAVGFSICFIKYEFHFSKMKKHISACRLCLLH